MEGKGVPKKGRPCQEPWKGKTFPIKIYKVLEAPAEDEPLEKPTNVKKRTRDRHDFLPNMLRLLDVEFEQDKDDIYVDLESLRHVPDRSDGTEETLPPTEQVDDVRKRDKAKKSNIGTTAQIPRHVPDGSNQSPMSCTCCSCPSALLVHNNSRRNASPGAMLSQTLSLRR
ncbi:hypothetical protein DPEC_G00059480 [Dallia pectoralis]|uniref:Uncharacterized protein n=1 Tax=Dallia pectoralis TaxID=75939 RepID=A0ACC2H6R7_DALPE|nr:hypothetical protein DPEC_G00059480 [Dallia pectoralis]